ncbi:MAG: 3-dehydroquinate synthase [Flaviflexus sp.]|nr:3-dehydroquinate synthase [Flaviflexus sp.]
MRPYAVFVGLPGSGKSTIASHIARRAGLEFQDSDELIVARERRSIPQIFEEEGEEGFRRIEAEVITEALSSFSGVLALGGGAVTTPQVRRALRGHRVVVMTADFDVLLERLRRRPGKRPLIDADPPGALARLRDEREPLYRQVATHVAKSANQPILRTADAVEKLLEEDVAAIDVGSYRVRIGRGLDDLVCQGAAGASAALIVHPADLAEPAGRLAGQLTERGIPAELHLVADGEAQKCSAELLRAWDRLGELAFGRDAIIIGLGGGATTDLAGFIAASWLRGIDVLQVPTSLLGMVDAAVGGKTGIDTSAGKNLVGAFHAPVGVIADLDHLRTLPRAELINGAAEMIKCGWIDDAHILDLMSRPGVLDDPWLDEAITRAIAVKARVVTEDFQERGLREILNYGHTLAHGIERAENYSIRHGEAVAIGCVFAAALAEAAGIAEAGLTERTRASMSAVGLPVTYTEGRREALLDAMSRDKKVRGGKLRFIVLNRQGEPRPYTPSHAELDTAFAAVGA